MFTSAVLLDGGRDAALRDPGLDVGRDGGLDGGLDESGVSISVVKFDSLRASELALLGRLIRGAGPRSLNFSGTLQIRSTLAGAPSEVCCEAEVARLVACLSENVLLRSLSDVWKSNGIL